MPTLPALMPDIDRCFSADSVAEIVAKLKKQPGEWAQKQLAALLKLSPLSMAITLEQLKRCANRSFEDTMTIEVPHVSGVPCGPTTISSRACARS